MTYNLRPIACLLLMLLILGASSAGGQSAPSPPPPKGNLSILSDPGGAQVFINEASYGRTPIQLSLPAGTYHLRLEKKGYVTIKEEVQVKEGEDTALDFELEEKE